MKADSIPNASPNRDSSIKEDHKSQRAATYYNNKQRNSRVNHEIPSSNQSIPSNDVFDLKNQINIIGSSVEDGKTP